MKKIASLLLLLAFCFSFASCQMQFDNSMTDWEVAFELGGVNENGRFVYSSSSLRTVSPILCDGLTLIPDDDFSVKYRFFYYDENGVFLGHSAAMTDASSAKVPSKAVYAYIMLTPLDEYGMPLEKIDPLDVVDYAEKITVKINKKQSYSPNLVELAKRNKYRGMTPVSQLTPQQIVEYSYFENVTINNSAKAGETLKLAENDKFTVLVLDCSKVKSYILTPTKWNTSDVYCTFWSYDKEYIETGTYNEGAFNGSDSQIVNIREGACYAIFHLIEYENVSLSVYEYR